MYLSSFFLCLQDASAPCSFAVFGAVLRGHSVSTGHGVLPSGWARFFSPSLLNRAHPLLFAFVKKQPEQPVPCLRVTRRATCTAVDRPTPRLPTLCSCSEWRVILPRGFCTCTKTTLFTGKVCQLAPWWLPSPVLQKGKNKSIWMFNSPPAGFSLQQHPGAA